MALILPGSRLMPRMDATTLGALGQEIGRALDDLARNQAPRTRAIPAWWSWYYAQPKFKERDFPFKGASNVVVPIIGITCDALSSRSVAQMTAAAPAYWSIRTENEANIAASRNMARFVNWQADGNDFSIKHLLNAAFPEKFVVGRSVVAFNHRRDVRPFFFGRQTVRGLKLDRIPVTFFQGVDAEHVPAEHMLWDLAYRVGDAPLVARWREWTWAELRDMAKLDDAWDRGAIDKVRRHPGTDRGDESDRVSWVKADVAGVEKDSLDLDRHGVWEVYVDWSMLGNRFEVPGEEEWGGEQVPLCLHLHQRTSTVLRLVGSPYLLPYKPFVDFRWRHGHHGVAKALEQMQAMMTAGVNQAFDAQTRANALWGMTRNSRHNKTPIDPSRFLLVDSMDEVKELNFGNSVQPNLALITILNTLTERWMGHSDPLLGRDTRSGGHPAPATSTLALLEQVNVMSAGDDTLLQEELSRLGEGIAILDQQFEDNNTGRLQAILGLEDAMKAGEFLFPDQPIPGNYFFDVVALSRTENPDTKMRRALTVMQAYQNYASLTVMGAQVLDMPPDRVGPRVKAVWSKLLDGAADLMGMFLDASNVDDAERFYLELSQLGVDARNAYNQFRSEAAVAAQAAQGAGPGAAGPLGGGSGNLAANGSLGGVPGGAAGGAGFPGIGGGTIQ